MTRKTITLKTLVAATLIGASSLSAAVIAPGVAYADIAAAKALVDAAKAKGIVGETSTGFLDFVTASGDAALKSAVAEINAGRRDVYAQAAARNGVSVEAAGASAFTNIILPKMAAGEYYQDANGDWKQK